jgi:hypothetical protein
MEKRWGEIDLSMRKMKRRKWYIQKRKRIKKLVFFFCTFFVLYYKKNKGVPQQAEVAQGVPGRLRPLIILTFQQ